MSEAKSYYLLWRTTPGKKYVDLVEEGNPSIGYHDDGCRSCRVDLAENAEQLADCLTDIARDLSRIVGGVLPDGDHVSVPVSLWADQWLTRLVCHTKVKP